MTEGCRAAVEVAEQLGLGASEPVLIQETNNTVVWLRPHAIIAKVATRADSVDEVIREHGLISALHGLGADVVAPIEGVSPTRHQGTGYVVTLSQRLDSVSGPQPPSCVVGRSLDRLHQALCRCQVPLPSFRVGLERARRALADDRLAGALAHADRRLLCSAFDEMLVQLDDNSFREIALHGEPHDGNYLMTSGGLRWIDFEAACVGPLEWDLAFLGEEGVGVFTDVDLALLGLLRTLNSARVATWCWVRYRFPELRWHAQHHLRVVRRAGPRADEPTCGHVAQDSLGMLGPRSSD